MFDYIFLYYVFALFFFFAIDLWHKEEKKDDACFSKNVLDYPHLFFKSDLVETILLYGINSEIAKSRIFNNKITGFYDYE